MYNFEKIGSKDQFLRTFAEVAKPGAFYEFGVYEGGTARLLAEYGRNVYAYDTYTGMPAYGFDNKVDHDEPGKFRPRWSTDILFRGFDNIIPVVGEYRDTLKDFTPKEPIALVHMDCDLYSSYTEVFNAIIPYLEIGTPIIIDDYFVCKGARKACDEKLKGSWHKHGEVYIWQ